MKYQQIPGIWLVRTHHKNKILNNKLFQLIYIFTIINQIYGVFLSPQCTVRDRLAVYCYATIPRGLWALP